MIQHLKVRLTGISLKVILLTATLCAIGLPGCKKLVEAPAPYTSVNAANVYATDATAIPVLTGIYAQLSTTPNFQGLNGFDILLALSGDELTLYSGLTNSSQNFYYSNSLTNGNPDFWKAVYPQLFTINSAIEGLSASNTLTPSVKRQLLGEAEFMRAFCYFYLVNLYGDVPLITSTDYKSNALSARTPKAQVWAQIIADLKAAQVSLNNNFLDGTLLAVTTERVRPTSWAATALLARVYLYTADWANAYTQSSLLIANHAPFTLALVPDLNSGNVFLANSQEAIWQLQPVDTNPTNTWDGGIFILPPTGPSRDQPVYLSSYLLNSFEAGDQRRTNWVSSVTSGGTTYYFPFKYKVAGSTTAPVTEYTMVLRLAEQYLIRAEAEANGAGRGTAAAIADINVIRKRAGLSNTPASTQQQLLAAILHERQVELFMEWGSRWLDLKRTGNVDAVMGTGGVCAAKGGTWRSEWALYPIPLTELNADPSLVQNPGY
ncbi:RagB/SusD family nutrient uptake outer membrane protein [Mucilaginibacter sp. AW1-3]